MPTTDDRRDAPDLRQDGAKTDDHRPDDHLPDNRKEKLDQRLDDGLEETFPSSDPVSVKITK
ncbi:hypothetical protein [Methylobacterium sp. JK268]